MSCTLVINKDSGNCEKLDLNMLVKKFGCDNALQIIDSKTDWSADGFDTVVVCGGDGTLHNALEKCPQKKLVYVPCGTLNEAALTSNEIRSIGKVNGQIFSYVCATGSFTEIGYSAQNKVKKRWKSLAYLPQVLKNYKVHDIAASIRIDDKKFEGNYTLLMIIKSYRCFGFAFNPDFKKSGKCYLLAVKSPGKDNLANRIKIFLPFFKIFFLGITPQIASHWMLLPFDNLEISLDKPRDFCFDGEKRRLQGVLHFSECTLDNPIRVFRAPMEGRKYTRF